MYNKFHKKTDGENFNIFYSFLAVSTNFLREKTCGKFRKNTTFIANVHKTPLCLMHQALSIDHIEKICRRGSSNISPWVYLHLRYTPLGLYSIRAILQKRYHTKEPLPPIFLFLMIKCQYVYS